MGGCRTAQHGARAIAAFALASVVAVLCAACGEQATCWNLHPGDHFTIELVELYTAASSYGYQSVMIPNRDPPVSIDSSPSCGAGFDFNVGDTLHATITDVAATDEDTSQCRTSTFKVDSPLRTELESTVTGGDTYPYVDAVTQESEVVRINGCESHRSISLVSQPGHSDAKDPVPGQLPSVVLVRSASLPLATGGSCELSGSATSCADQFVVRLKRD